MKRFISIFMSLVLTLALGSVVFAEGGAGAGGAAAGDGVSTITITQVTSLNGILGKILGIVQVIAVAFATGMLLYVGIKYTMASANEKADLKKGSISYVIGAVIIFGSAAILEVVQKLAGEF